MASEMPQRGMGAPGARRQRHRQRHRQRGQGLVEYALIILFVAIAVFAILALLGPVIGNIFSQIVPAL